MGNNKRGTRKYVNPLAKKLAEKRRRGIVIPDKKKYKRKQKHDKRSDD